MNPASRRISLSHLIINDQRQIGIKFYPDKVIQSLIKSIEGIKWSNKYGLAYLQNNNTNLNKIYTTFKGVASIDGRYFYINKPLHDPVKAENLYRFTKERKAYTSDHKTCPKEFLQNLKPKK